MLTEDATHIEDPAIVALKMREVELLRARLDLQKENGIEFYRPSEKQHLFHCSVAKRRGVFAGNRFGKSESSAAETIAWFIGERSWYRYSFPIYGVEIKDGKRFKKLVSFHEGHPDHPLVKQGIPSHSTKQLIICTEWKKVDEVWTGIDGDNPGKVWKYIPKKCKFRVRRNHDGCIDRIIGEADSPIGAGCIIRFTTEQAFIKNPQSSESTDYDRVGVDEPIVEEMWKANARGLVDRDGQGDFTLTALRERWIYDYFFDDTGKQTHDTGDRFAVRATMDDNPHLSDRAIERYMGELSDEEKDCRRRGIPLELSGLVYKNFHREKHVLTSLPVETLYGREGQVIGTRPWSSYSDPAKGCTIYVSVDVHSQTNQAALFVAVPPVGAPIVYDEIWKSCVADVLVEDIKAKIDGRNVGFIKADPKAWEEDPVFKVSMASRFFQAGLNIEKASKAKDFGVKNLQSLFDKPAGSSLWIAPSCKRLLWEISRYIFDKENKPIDKDDHFMECLYRLFIVPLVHIDFSPPKAIPQHEIPNTRIAMRDFDIDMATYGTALGLRN